MDIQLVIVIALFAAALAYVGWMIYKSLSSSKGCASNCGKCGVDFSQVKLPETKSSILNQN